MRVTKKELDQALSLINEGREYPEIGYYYLMGAYGGWKLVQIVNEGGGVRDVFPRLGYAAKREMMTALTSFIEGRNQEAILAHYGIKKKGEE